MEKSLVSIIAPTYNHEKYISECIESVLTQSYPYWEMIIVDDASNDETPHIIESYAKNDSRIKFIRHRENWGMYRLVDTYNQALEMSNGIYIAILEGDDFWPSYKLELQCQAMKDNNMAVLSYGLEGLFEYGKVRIVKNRVSKEVRENKPVGSILKAFLIGLSPVKIQTVMIQSKFLKKIGGFLPRGFPLFLIDYPTLMELSLYGEFLFIPRILGYWRRQFPQISSLYAEKMLEEYIGYIEYFIKEKKSALEELDVDFTKYIDNYGYNLFFTLCKLKMKNGLLVEAKMEFKEIIKRKRIIISDFKEIIKLALLFAGLRLPFIYNISENVSDILNRYILKEG